ncbi:MAG: DUF2809 domain-containing protein [Candidatus Eisenbacteria bacterium]|uniref:DUF2809 domain-containing protein n=1 Tax=Eiseniibacteriota bacterium TaxID=2212470 RepID=A0A849SRB2_UNCEI|nr:DUF2809 domain-containing protein [Candidatus Eisenbacteria bacterium]
MSRAIARMLPSLRARVTFVVLAVGTIALGLGVHAYGSGLGSSARDVVGDALWAMMIAWWIGALAPSGSLRVRSAVAFAICVGVELSQLLRTPELDALRSTPVGQLVLGSGFDARDLVAYAVGVLGAVGLELAVHSRQTRASRGE